MPRRPPYIRPLRCGRPSDVTMVTTILILLLLRGTSEAKELYSPRHIAKLKAVTSVAISPDGKQIAYTLAVPREPLEAEDGLPWVELHVADEQGNVRPFVTGKVNVSDIKWTLDGKAIAFIAKRGEDKHNAIYAVPIDGGEARRVAEHESDVQAFDYSQDGAHIAFLATEPLAKEQEEYKEKGFNQEIYEEDWRPTKVWITDSAGSSKPRVLDLQGSASLVQWRPSSRHLVVVLAPTPSVDDSFMFRRIYVVDADTGKVVGKVENAGKLGLVRWSPDGKHLALISGIDINDPAEGRLMIAGVAGDEPPRDLMPDYQAHVNSFEWKDAKTLLWVADEGVATTIGTVDVAGKKQVNFGPDVPVLSGIALSDDGLHAAFIGQSAEHPPEVYSLKENRPHRLTQSNPWLADVRLARQEAIPWTARDGLKLEGILVYPVNYEPGRRYPMLMVVHGGPEAHVSNGWVTHYASPGQVGAARGFAVFYPNYRGSTGRGVEFSKKGQRDAAGKEFEDLVDGVDHLVQLGLVLKDKVGITGGSYGGYATAWGATYYSDRFAAAVMFVGISDNISKLGTTDIPEEMYHVHHRKRLWEDWDYFLQRSPIRHVQKHQTPILILHGKIDPRVHPSQSLELYRHLKTLNQAPVRLVLYPGEGHGNRRAAARLDYNLRLMQWMEHYLQGPGGSPPKPDIDYKKFLQESTN